MSEQSLQLLYSSDFQVVLESITRIGKEITGVNGIIRCSQ